MGPSSSASAPARFVSAGVVAHTLWTSAAPAMVYRLYAEEWHLSHTVTTGIFAIYPIIVVGVLIGFGGISDHVGRRITMLVGLGASLIGTLLFAVAPNVLLRGLLRHRWSGRRSLVAYRVWLADQAARCSAFSSAPVQDHVPAMLARR